MSTVWLEARGTFVVSNGDCRIVVDEDFCKYYKKLLEYFEQEKIADFQIPRYGAHITIISTKIHGYRNTSKLEMLSGISIPFLYDADIKKGGTRFTTYYASVKCPFANLIKKELMVVEPSSFLGFHICITNNKAKIKNENNNCSNVYDRGGG